MTTEGFRFQIERAIVVWSGRFITIEGQLLEGSISTMDPISIPLTNGTRKVNRAVSLSENWKEAYHIATDPGLPKEIVVQIWGGNFPVDMILSLGIAIKAEPPDKEETHAHA
jgi:hypothetical protein